MDNQIPKIIHQVWEGLEEPLPEVFYELANTWKKFHPHWEYIQWDYKKIRDFMHTFYPEYEDAYNHFYFKVQRWDVIRYLILYQLGGVYIDFDYECIDSMEGILKRDCCFAMEPLAHQSLFMKDSPYFNNAFMAARPKHPFMKEIITTVFLKDLSFCPRGKSRFEHVLCTTGPIMLSETYAQYTNKESIYLIPAEYVSPFSSPEIKALWRGVRKNEWDQRLQKAVAVHYFMGTWDK